MNKPVPMKNRIRVGISKYFIIWSVKAKLMKANGNKNQSTKN